MECALESVDATVRKSRVEVWNIKFRAECGVWTAECKVWSVKRRVYRVQLLKCSLKAWLYRPASLWIVVDDWEFL